MQVIKLDNPFSPEWHNPLILNGNNLYTVKISLDFNSFYPVLTFKGFFKYNITNKSYQLLQNSNSISEYYLPSIYGDNVNYIHYVAVEDIDSYFRLNFFVIDLRTGIEKKYFSQNINKLINEPNERDALDQCKLFPLNKRYVVLLVDKVRNLNEQYNSLESLNEYDMHIIDLFDMVSYKVLDDNLFKNGITNMDILVYNKIEYLIVKSGLLHWKDKEWHWKEQRNMRDIQFRGYKDALIWLPLDEFIDQIKKNINNLKYNKVESTESSGSINYIKPYNGKLYYEVKDFERKSSQFVSYDIIHKKYERFQLKNKYNSIFGTLNKFFTLSKNNKFGTLTEIAEEEKFAKYQLELTEEPVFFDGKILVTQKVELKEEELHYFSIMYDAGLSSIKEKLEGRPAIFENDRTMVLY